MEERHSVVVLKTLGFSYGEHEGVSEYCFLSPLKMI